MNDLALIVLLLLTNLAWYVIGYTNATQRAAADIDDAFDTGHAFGTYRGQP